jgi:hypothetical protein
VEPSKAKRSSKVLIIAVAFAIGVIGFLVWLYKDLHAVRLSKYVRTDLPMLELQLQFVDLQGKKVAPETTRLGNGKERESGKPSGDCPELIGGDTRERSEPSPTEKRGEKCPQVATWRVRRHPIGFSLAFQEPQAILSMLNDNARAKELLGTKFFQGLFIEPLHSASVRAEDLHLEGLEGAFLKQFLREALTAHSELHYDVVHGKKGFVFSFVRDECPFAAKALPIVARVLARSGYRVAKLKEPILEMRIGLQRLFLTQHQDRVYLANGLEGLLNVLESLSPSNGKQPKTPLLLTMRSEAFVDKLLPVMVGKPGWEMELGLGLSEESVGLVQLAGGKFSRQLRPKVFKGVLASLPHDVFAAVVTSYYLDPKMSIQEWQRLATEGPAERLTDGPDEAGVAVLWELGTDKERITQIGIAIANQKNPDEVDKFKQYFANPELTAECGGGTVFLAATSPGLLARMKDACGGQSMSVLDWERGSKRKEYETSQLFLFMNPGAGMRELFLAGGAQSGENGEFEPEWKQEYEQAKETMRQDGEKVFGGLPIFAYAGNVAASAPMIQLKGFSVKQGASR